MADAIEIFTSSASERIEVITSGAQGPKGDAGATFDQDLNTTDAVTFASVNAPLYDAALSQDGASVNDGVLDIHGASGTAKLDTSDLTGTRSHYLPDESGHLALTENTATAAQGALADTAVQPNTTPTLTGLSVKQAGAELSVSDDGIGSAEKRATLKPTGIEFFLGDGTNAISVAPAAGSGGKSFTLPSNTGTLALTSQIPSTFAASAITSGTMDAARLGSGTASSGTWLRGDSTWQALPAAGTKTYARWTAMDNQPPSTAFATLDTRNSIAVLDFDAATDENAVFVSVMPEGASLGSGLTVYLHWMATSATSGNVRWGAQIERSNTDLDSDSFDTATEASGAANATSGIVTVTSITLTNIDSVTAGDLFRLKIYRNADDATNDTMTGDAELVAVEVRSAA